MRWFQRPLTVGDSLQAEHILRCYRGLFEQLLLCSARQSSLGPLLHSHCPIRLRLQRVWDEAVWIWASAYLLHPPCTEVARLCLLILYLSIIQTERKPSEPIRLIGLNLPSKHHAYSLIQTELTYFRGWTSNLATPAFVALILCAFSRLLHSQG